MDHTVVPGGCYLFCLLVKSVVGSSWTAGPNEPNPISMGQLGS
jgi:hypothetical protein